MAILFFLRALVTASHIEYVCLTPSLINRIMFLSPFFFFSKIEERETEYELLWKEQILKLEKKNSYQRERENINGV